LPWWDAAWEQDPGGSGIPPSWASHALRVLVCCRWSFASDCFGGLDIPIRGLYFPPPSHLSFTPHPGFWRCQAADVPRGRAERACVSGESSLREIIDFGSASSEIWEENK